MSASFEELGLSPALLKAIEDMGFEEPSPIQTIAVPPLLEGKDAIGQAQTGTGKTAAFGLPILEKLSGGSKNPHAIVLCPTRELAIQVAEEMGRLAAYKKDIFILPVYGGQPIERQFRALSRGVQVVVGTPGRVIDHLERGTLRLDEVSIAVLDEADEMLDMGFREDIEAILEQIPEESQRVMFSATMRGPILELSKRFLRDPEMLTIPHKMLTVPAIEQTYYEVRPFQKMDALCRVLDSQGFRKALVFCSTKRSVDEVTEHLQGRGYQADGLHGNLAQPQRDRVMNRFRTGGIEILVATDVAARGIDVDDVDAVINFDIPHDVESYVHRIGRTGRAGREGRAFTFVTMRENYKLRDIMRYTRAHITQGRLPTLRDVANIRTGRLLEEVRKTMEEGVQERWLTLVEDFMSEQFPDSGETSRDMAAAMLKLLMDRDFGDQNANTEQEDWVEKEARRQARRNENGGFDRDRRDRGDREDRGERRERRERRPADENMTRLHLNVGYAQHVTPRDIVGAIAGECGIPGRSVGAIDIQTQFCLVDVESTVVDDVLNVLNSKVFINGTRVSAKKDEGPRPQRAFGAGRRQPAGRFGKKPRGATSGRKFYRDPSHRPEGGTARRDGAVFGGDRPFRKRSEDAE